MEKVGGKRQRAKGRRQRAEGRRGRSDSSILGVKLLEGSISMLAVPY